MIHRAEGESVKSVEYQKEPLKVNKDYFEAENAQIEATDAQIYEQYAIHNYGYIPYFVETLRRESGFQSIQSKVIRKDGTREPSYGCAQIHEPSHPDITREQAMDCIWSLSWASQQFLKGKACMWTEYRNITKQTIENCKTL